MLVPCFSGLNSAIRINNLQSSSSFTKQNAVLQHTSTDPSKLNINSLHHENSLNKNPNLVKAVNSKNGNLALEQSSIGSIIKTINVGSNPWDIALDTNNGFLFVSNSGTNTISVINTTTNSVTTTIQVDTGSSNPMGIAFDPQNGYIYVANSGTCHVSVIDGTTLQVLTEINVCSGSVNSPWGLIYDPNNNDLYVTYNGGYLPEIIDGSTNTVSGSITINVPSCSGGSETWQSAYDSITKDIYLHQFCENYVIAVNAKTNVVDQIINAQDLVGYGTVYDSINNNIYTTSNSGLIGIINTTSYSVTNYINAQNYGFGTGGGTFDPDNNLSYYSSNNGIAVVNDSTNTIIGNITGTGTPIGILYDSFNYYVYVVEYGGEVDVISTPNTNNLNKTVTFMEYGLPKGTDWNVTFNATTQSSTNNTIAFSILNGYYSYSIGTISGYTTFPTTGTIKILNNYISKIYFVPSSPIPAGNNPQNIAFDSNNKFLYVTDANSNSVSVINSLNSTTIGTIQGISSPFGVIYCSDNNFIYITSFTGSGNISVINTNTNTIVKTINPGQALPEYLAYDSMNKDLYITNEEIGTITVIDTVSNSILKIITLPTGSSPTGIAYDPNNQEAYISSGGQMLIINCTSNTFDTTIPYQSFNNGGPMEMVAFDSNNGYIYATDYTDGHTISVIDPSSNQLLETIGVGIGSYGIIFNSFDNNLYVTNYESFSVSVVSGSSNIVIGNISLPLNSFPTGIAFDSVNNYTYVIDSSFNELSVITHPYTSTSLQLNIKTGQVGEMITVTGYNFAVNSQITLTFGNQPLVTTPSTIITSSTGSFSSTFDVPSLTDGNYIVNATDTSNNFAYSTFTISSTAKFNITFIEQGLPTGTEWQVTLNNLVETSTNDNIIFSEPNGVYSYIISQITGYVSSPESNTVSINNANRTISIIFSPSNNANLYSVTFIEVGLPVNTLWNVSLNSNTQSSISDSIVFYETPNNYQFSINTINDYIPNISQGMISIVKNNITKDIQFTKTNPITTNQGMVAFSGNIYYANSSGNNILVYNQATNNFETSINVGNTPVSLSVITDVFHTNNHYLIVVNQFSNNISIIDLNNNTVLMTVNTGLRPISVAVNSHTDQIYITNFDSSSITVFNIKNFPLISKYTIPVLGEPTGITIDSNTNTLYVSLYNKNEVEVISVNQNSNNWNNDEILIVGSEPMGVTLDNLGQLLVADSGSSTISMYLPTSSGNILPSNEVAKINVGSNPIGISSTNSNSPTIFVVYENSYYVTLINEILWEESLPVTNITENFIVSAISASSSSGIMVNPQSNQLVIDYLFPVTFDFSGGSPAYILNNDFMVSVPYVTMPVIIYLPIGTYSLNYNLQAGYDNPQLLTSGSISLIKTNSETYLSVQGAGEIELQSEKIPQTWKDVTDFTVTSTYINLATKDLSPLLLSQEYSNLNAYNIAFNTILENPIIIYKITASSSVSQSQFKLDLANYFGITTPDGFYPYSVTILHIPILPLLNSLLNQNEQNINGIDLASYLPKSFFSNSSLFILSPNGDLNIALTYSFANLVPTTNVEITNLLGTIIKNLIDIVKGKQNVTDVIVSDALNYLVSKCDFTVSVITSSLSAQGKLAGYDILDFQHIYNSLEEIQTVLEDFFDIWLKITNLEDNLLLFGVTIEIPGLDIVTSALVIYNLFQLGFSIIKFFLDIYPIINPNIISNNIYNIITHGVSISLEIMDPNQSTIYVSVYDENNQLVLGYNPNNGNITYSNNYGLIMKVGSDFSCYLYENRTDYTDYTVKLYSVGYNETIPYILRITYKNDTIVYNGMIPTGNSTPISILESNGGKLIYQTYLFPKYQIIKQSNGYFISATPYLSNGSLISAINSYLVINGTNYEMKAVNNSYYTFLLPFNMSSESVYLYMIASNIPGGFVLINFPQQQKIQLPTDKIIDFIIIIIVVICLFIIGKKFRKKKNKFNY